MRNSKSSAREPKVIIVTLQVDVNSFLHAGSATLVKCRLDGKYFISKKVNLAPMNEKERAGALQEVSIIWILLSDQTLTNIKTLHKEQQRYFEHIKFVAACYINLPNY